MDQNIKAQWVAALRSGEYAQGKKALSLDNQYCCLGVLCDLAEKAGAVESITDTVDSPDFESDEQVVTKFYGKHSASSFLPQEVVKWSGVQDGIVDVHTPAVEGVSDAGLVSLHILNDTGSTFAEIADLIEQDTEL